MERQNLTKQSSEDREFEVELPTEHPDKFIMLLHGVIHFSVRVLALLMVLLILWGVADVVLVLYLRLMSPPFMLLKIEDIVATFGAFMAVLIAIEIFENITVYIRKDILPIKLVIATALMAVARKVIVFDYNLISPIYLIATAAIIISLGVAYWLVSQKHIPIKFDD